MEYKRLTRAIQEHLWEGKEWPGINCLGGKQDKTASEIATNIAQFFKEDSQRVVWNRPPEERLTECIEFATNGGDYPDNGIVDCIVSCSMFARLVRHLAQVDVASARHICRILNHAAMSKSADAMDRWQDYLSTIDCRCLEDLFSGDVELAITAWTARHLLNQLDLDRPFGIEFMKRLVLKHADQLPDEFWDDVLINLPCWASCALLKSLVGKGATDLEQIPGFADNSSVTIAALVTRNLDQGGSYPSMEGIEILLYGGDFSPPALVTRERNVGFLVRALAVLRHLNHLKLTSWQLADVCSAMPGWRPFERDFDDVVAEYAKGMAASIRNALGDGGSNVSNLVLGFL